jgi:hypothetical protein
MASKFNYISFNNRDQLQGENVSFNMPRGRMFEYTPDDTAKRLERLDQEALEYIENLPTFLCSEIEVSETIVTMVIKVGWLTEISVENNSISGNFRADINYEVVSFEDIDAARSIFDADQFQLYRTHWAIRTGDVREVVERLARHLPEQSPSELTDKGIKNAPPPDRNKNILGKADSVESFLELLYRSTQGADSEVFFRGHSDDKYELTPSLLRRNDKGDWEFLPKESLLCNELLIAHDDEFHRDESRFDHLVRMQHFGLPTRLLDITSNPLIALFFACSEPEVTGEVVLFHIDKELFKYYDSDTVTCISNLSNLPHEIKDSLDLSLDSSEFNKQKETKELLGYVKREKGSFNDDISPEDLRSIVCVKAKRSNTRIKSQSGAFLLFGHEANLPDYGQIGIDIERISIVEKEIILNQLNLLNINSTTVYPSIQETASYLRTKFKA